MIEIILEWSYNDLCTIHDRVTSRIYITEEQIMFQGFKTLSTHLKITQCRRIFAMKLNKSPSDSVLFTRVAVFRNVRCVHFSFRQKQEIERAGSIRAFMGQLTILVSLSIFGSTL